MPKIIKNLLALALLSFCSLVHAGETITEHKLWRIRDQSGQQKGYLLGSAHLPISFPYLMKLFPVLNEIFHEVTDVAIENCLTDLQIEGCEASEQKIKSFLFNCERGLGSLLTEDELTQARNKLAAVYGEDSDFVQNISCLTAFMAMESGIQGDLIMDWEIASYAQWNSKKVHTLEKYEFLESNIQLPLSIQRRALQNWLRVDNYHTSVMDYREVDYYMNRIVECYSQGDHCHIQNLVTETVQYLKMEPDMQEYTGILQQRNHCWLPSIMELLSEENKNTLFIAGLYHFYEKDNLRFLLQSKGYTIEPVALIPSILSFSDILAFASEEFFWSNVRALKEPWIILIAVPLYTLEFLATSIKEYHRNQKKFAPRENGTQPASTR